MGIIATLHTTILWLAFAITSFLPASALSPTAPENRIWEKITGTLETHQEAAPQVPQSHQEETTATAETASECFLAAEDAGARSGMKCFAAGTQVATPQGEKNIEDIHKGDTVYAYDFNSKQVVCSKVSETVRNYTYHWADVRVGNETIHATRSHKFWVSSQKQWVEAAHLKAGMTILLENGETDKVKTVRVRDLIKPERTYNFVVQGQHDYFVGRHQVLVHNGLPDPSDIPPASGQFDVDHRYSQSAFPDLANDPNLQTPLDSTMNRGQRAAEQRALISEENDYVAKGMSKTDARAATQSAWDALANSVDAYPSGKVTTGEYSGVAEGPPCD